MAASAPHADGQGQDPASVVPPRALAAVAVRQPIAQLDLEGTILWANDAFAQLCGHPTADLVGRRHCELLRDPDASATVTRERGLWSGLSRGVGETVDSAWVTPSGRVVWVRANYSSVLDDDSRPVGVVISATDITADRARCCEAEAKFATIDRSQAVVEFDLDGVVLHANPNFLSLFGYTLAEVVGQQHCIFVPPEDAASPEYTTFWDKLRRGDYASGEFRRVAADGSDVWIQATYNPVIGLDGAPLRIVKFALDVTQAKVHGAEIEGKVAAVDRAQAVIEFDLEGNTLDANDNFLRTIGYSLREIKGQHHSMFCSPEYVVGAEYRDFWLRLRNGEFISDRFHRVGKFGRDVWIQASYNPILDAAGRPVKVVKFAYDVSDQVALERRLDAKTREMTESVQELVTSIAEIAGSTAEATNLSQQTQSNAEQGAEALRESNAAINLIQKSSSEIGDIVAVIGEIANQTNLLAFNASIEAARAGEHGVGFSVVAGEVRKLAERSSEAAREIAKLIEESGVRVNQGAEVSRRAEEAFERIVGSVRQTSESIRRIADSTLTQQTASRNVTELISELAHKSDAGD